MLPGKELGVKLKGRGISLDKSTKYGHLQRTQRTENVAMRCVLRDQKCVKMLTALPMQTPWLNFRGRNRTRKGKGKEKNGKKNEGSEKVQGLMRLGGRLLPGTEVRWMPLKEIQTTARSTRDRLDEVQPGNSQETDLVNRRVLSR